MTTAGDKHPGPAGKPAGASEPSPVPPLRLLFWETTARCNLACVHCRRLSESAAEPDLSTDEAMRLLGEAATMGPPVVVFSGGEPLLRDDWPALAAHARRLRLPIALATNGTLIDPATADRIAAAGFRRVAISFDGADAATHDAFRGAAGAFARATAGAGELRARGVPLQVNVTVAAHNAHQLDAMLALAAGLGAVALHLFLLVPVGCGAQIERSHQLAAAEYERVLEWAADHEGDGTELRATCAPHYRRLLAERSGGSAAGRHAGRGCGAGTSVLFVSHSGEIFPCGYLPVRCGSVREPGSLTRTWAVSPVLTQLRDVSNLRGKCGLCGYKTVCGGCRARAFAAAGDWLGPEPFCLHDPSKMRETGR